MPETAMKPALPAVVACVILAACALPQQASSQPPAKATAHAVAPRTTPSLSLAAVVGDAENCAAGALVPGQSRLRHAFAECLGIDDVPAALVPLAEREFARHSGQGAEAVALAVKAAITERKN